MNYLKTQVQALQVPHDELLLGSLATQLTIKISRFERTNEHPSIAACRTISMRMAQENIQQLKLFLDGNGYNFEDICLAIRVLKSNRNSAAHPTDPTTSADDIQQAIDRLYPVSHPKRTLAENALKVLKIVSNKSAESFIVPQNRLGTQVDGSYRT